MSNVTVVFQGWNSSNQGWGSGGWGEDVPLAAGTGQIGLFTVSDSQAVSGVSSTISVGSVTAIGGADVLVTGVSCEGQVGTALVWSEIVPSQDPQWTPIMN